MSRGRLARIDAPRWVTVSVAASMLNIAPSSVASLALRGKIRRRPRRVNIAMTRARWMYSVDDIATLRKRAPTSPAYDANGRGPYLPANEAAGLLGCSVSAIRVYRDEGDVEVKEVTFYFPRRRTCEGYLLADLLVLRTRMHRQRRPTAFEEDTVLWVETLNRASPRKVKPRAQREAIKELIERLQGMLG